MPQIEEWDLHSELHDLLQSFTRSAHPINVLLVGPAGAGKSTLVTHAARASSLPVIALPPSVLSCDSSEAVEEGLASMLAEAEERAPCVLLLDDADHWLPPSVSSPAHLHLLALLCERILELREPPHIRIAFIAVTRNAQGLHPALRSSMTALTTICVRPLGESERANILRSALQAPDADIDSLVARTPGYVAADAARLLLEARRLARASSALTLTSEHVRAALPRIRPLLLGAHSARWHFGAPRSPVTPLFGLERAESALRAALAGAFARGDSPAHTALQAVGRARGVLVHGPSGSGKSALLARAARHAHADAHVLRVDAVDVVSAIVGAAERALAELFSAMRAAAPALLVLENLQLLAPHRDALEEAPGSAARALERVLATLLVEIDGVHADSVRPVLLLASAPSLDMVDPAMLRPGRFEVHVETTLPDKDARRLLLEYAVGSMLPVHARGMVLAQSELIDGLAGVTEGWTAADITALVREIVFGIVREEEVAIEEEAWMKALAAEKIIEKLNTFLVRRLDKKAVDRVGNDGFREHLNAAASD